MPPKPPDVTIAVQDVTIPRSSFASSIDASSTGAQLFGPDFKSDDPSQFESTTRTADVVGDGEADAQQLELVGDPLKDLPEAGEGGPVALLKENVDDISTFMMRYGIETGRYKRKRERIVLPPWMIWLVNAWREAGKELGEEDGEPIDDGPLEDSDDLTQSDGLTEKLRQHRQNAISGKTAAGTHYLVWLMFRMLCAHLEKTNAFNNFFNFLIVFNALFLGMKVDDVWTGGFVGFMENAFVALFFIEVVVRLASDDKDTANNTFLWFDSAIVLVSVLDVWVLPLLLQFELDFDFRILHVFRVMRIIRLARLLRLVSWLRPLRLMERSFRRGVIHYMSIVVLLATIFYSSALVFRSLFAGVAQIWANTPEDFDANTFRLMMYLVEAMLSGFDWKDKMVDPLLDNGSHMLGIILIIFMFCTKTALANLLTGSMIENYLFTMELDGNEVRQDELHRILRVKELEELLEQVDHGSDGRISWDDFKAFASHANGPRLLNILGINSRVKDDEERRKRLLDMRRLFLSFDPVGDGSIPIDMFKIAYLQLKGGEKTLEGLIVDFSLKALLKTSRRPNENAKDLDQKIFNICTHMKDEKTRIHHTLLDFEDIVKQVQPSLAKFETVVGQMNSTLQSPEDDEKAVPAACATVAKMQLQEEINATREAALAFLKSQGKKIELSALLRAATPN